jgi:MoxR-like ATPase
LDRFLFNVILDYLTTNQEVDVVHRNTGGPLPEVKPCTSAEEILRYQWLVRQVPISEDAARYAVDLVRATRPRDPLAPEVIRKYVNYGGSVRATQFLVMAAKARALMAGRYHVTVEDLRALTLPVLRHRVLTNFHAESDGLTVDDILNKLLAERPAPQR